MHKLSRVPWVILFSIQIDKVFFGFVGTCISLNAKSDSTEKNQKSGIDFEYKMRNIAAYDRTVFFKILLEQRREFYCLKR
jgi:hypothetical protein